MKIAIPTRNNEVDNHFGHCESYTVYTISEDKSISNTEAIESPQGCGCKSNIAGILKNEGVSLMLAGNMGEGAFQMLTMHGIKVIRGCSGNTDSLIKEYLNDRVSDNGHQCDHHGHHGHDHEHGHQCNH